MPNVTITIQNATAAVLTWDKQFKPLTSAGGGWTTTFNEPTPGLHMFSINVLSTPGSAWSGTVTSGANVAAPQPGGTTNGEGHARSVGVIQC